MTCCGLSAQTISGVIQDGRNDSNVSNVRITDESTGLWTVSDENGNFSLNYNPGAKLIFSKSGWMSESMVYNTVPKDRVQIKLFPVSIRIPEVKISAKKDNFSSIEISEEALQKTQSFSLGDVLQQLPGQYIQPINNTEMKNIVLRTANTQSVINSSAYDQDFGNKAFGTQLMINDVTVSNNSNMQDFNAAYNNPFTTGFNLTNSKGNVTPAQPNYGVDLRQIPTEDIEKIEVIAGVPDAKYGDLTSGLIKVETKIGQRPLQFQASIVEGTYQAGASKGFLLNKKGDAINASFNYMNSTSDPRFSDVTYERFTANLGWAFTNKSKSIRNRMTLNVSSDTNEGQGGEDEYHGIYINAKNQSYSLTNNTNLKFRNSWLKTFNANIGVNYADQSSMRRNFLNSASKPYGTSLTDDVYYANYTPSQYFNYNYVDGKPLNIFLDMDVNSIYKTNSNWIHNLSLGINYRYSDNFGTGRYGTVGQFAGISTVGATSNGTREYNYSDNVLSMSQFAVYMQDNIFKKFANQNVLNANLGVRYDLQNNYSTVSPRVNASYRIKNIKLRGGIGLSTKAPSLNQVYTGPRYIDILLGDYRLPGVYSVAIMQTVVTPANNADLKPSKSWRSELGFDLNLPFANLALTGYNNFLFDGFTSYSNVLNLPKAKVEVTATGTELPTFEIVGTENYRFLQTLQTNGYDSRDLGLEMMLAFKKIESLNLSIGLKGAYTHTKSEKKVETLVAPANDDPEVAYGIFNPYQVTSKVARLGLSLDYHLPKAGMIISINTDHFLVDSRTSSVDTYAVAYLDQNLIRHTITEADLQNPVISALRSSSGPTAYNLDGKTFHNFHLRVSKDFLSGIRISVYLNNMFNLKVYDSYGTRYTNFTPISFGGNISYQF